MTEFSAPDSPEVDNPEKAAYAELDRWLEGATLGDVKLLALSDTAALQQAKADALLKEDILPEDHMENHARRALITERIREREDTVPGYFSANQELQRMLNADIIPYERSEMNRRMKVGHTITVPNRVSIQLGARRQQILNKSKRQTDKS